MPDIKVVRVEKQESPKYGAKKVLYVDDGSKWNVSSKKPFYDAVTGPGMYSVNIKDFNGTQYISYLEFKGALNAQNATSQPVSSTGGSGSSGTNYQAKIDADKKRQDDIRLEFYCGLAKDIMIANKKDGVDINPNTVMAYGWAMYNRHLNLLEGKPLDDADLQPQETAESVSDEQPF